MQYTVVCTQFYIHVVVAIPYLTFRSIFLLLLQIFLNTFHKYFFEVVIEENQSDPEPLVFPFHLTQFIAVTAYQSAKLTELKKEKNPFARGVRHHESETDAYVDTSSTLYPPGKFDSV